MAIPKLKLGVLLLGGLFAVVAVDTPAALRFQAPIKLSGEDLSYSSAAYGRIVSLADGKLVAVYIEAVDSAPEKYVYDFFTDSERPARDVFVRSCDTTQRTCNDPLDWSAPVNISNTATKSSISTDWNGNGTRSPYYGDAEKPTVFSSGQNVVITWVDKYCPGPNGEATPQRTVTYPARNNREIAMSCVYAAHNSGDLSGAWNVDQLSDGSRDAKNDTNRGLSSGAWIVTWQEDPRGLQPGEGDGPGEGGSGAKVSPGTDIWYTYSTNVAGASANLGVWKTPLRLTDNWTGLGAEGELDPIRDATGNLVPAAEIDNGNAGASRANAMLVGGSSPPTALVAYEETKASGGLDAGKFIRYHAFPYNAPPTDAAGKAGCVISTPSENARRVRFVAQTRAGASGLRWSIFWRQGIYTKGGPADIVLRYGLSGFSGGDLVPAVDPGCQTSDYTAAVNLNNAAPLNMSSNTLTATAGNLSDASNANPDENARAHRAVLRGDELYLGYTYAPSDPKPGPGSASYNFYVRRFNAATGLWDNPDNLSNITDPTMSVREPRLVGTPGSGAGCADPAMPANPEDCQNPDVVFAAWTTTRIDPQLDTSQDLDILITRSSDGAKSFEPAVTLAGGQAAQGEAQLRITPDGNHLFAVWNETTDIGSSIDFVSGEVYTGEADLHIDNVAVAATAKKGKEIGLSVVAHNGPGSTQTASGVSVTVVLPASFTYKSAGATGAGTVNTCSHDAAANTVTCDIGDLADDQTATVSVVATPTAATGPSDIPYTVSASVSAAAPLDPLPDNNSLSAQVRVIGVSNLGITATASATTPPVNREVTVNYALTNQGADDATNTRFFASLPRDVTLVSATPDNGATCSVTGNHVVCELGTIPSNAPVVHVAVTFTVNEATGFDVVASVAADQTDPVSSDNSTFTAFEVQSVDSGGGGGAVNPFLAVLSLIAWAGLTRRQQRRGG